MSQSRCIRILGLDPGTAATGWGVIEHDAARSKSRLISHGTISTSACEPLPARLLDIYDGIRKVIDSYRPADAAVEELFGGINLKTALTVGQARGVIVLACAERGIMASGYTALSIKQAVAGYGRAGKSQVQQMVKALLGLDQVPRPDHAADALAVAICHAHSMKTSNAYGARKANDCIAYGADTIPRL